MFKNILVLSLIVLQSSVLGTLSAQTPTDAIMMGNGQVCIAAIYSRDSWDQYWEGTLLRENGNIGTFTRQSILPMVALGLSDRINIIAALPYVFTKSSDGYLRGTSGFQDFGLWLKAKAIDLQTTPGNFTVHATAGVTIPISGYTEDYAPYSLGMGCTDFSLRGILQYKLHSGPYLRGQAGYHIRGNAELERDYYYTTHGVYSNRVDMPNAMTYAIHAGSWFLNDALKVEIIYDGMNTLGGFDMRRNDAGFPANKMIFTRIGGGLQIYNDGFGLLGSVQQVLTGRNVGKSLMYTVGLTYQFGLWNKEETEVIDN